MCSSDLEPAPKCLPCGILCASFVAIHTKFSEINMKSGMDVNYNDLYCKQIKNSSTFQFSQTVMESLRHYQF